MRRGLLIGCVWMVLHAAAASALPPIQQGNVSVQGGTKMHYAIQLPDGAGPFPTVMTYDPYSAGSATPLLDYNWLADHGYAVVGVNLPNTGCSSAGSGLFDATSWGPKGADMIEWIARQSWSTGKVGMVGASFPGLSQFGVAGQHPAHLKAIAPFIPTLDFYRDILQPGGLYNTTWTTEYAAAVQPLLATLATAGVLTDPTGCAGVDVGELSAYVTRNAADKAARHPYRNAFWRRAPSQYAAGIRLPTLGCQAWDDGGVGSRSAQVFLHVLPPKTTWLIGNNGGHGTCIGSQEPLVAFLDHYLKGARNGWAHTPHIMLRHEVTVTTAAGGLLALLRDNFRTIADQLEAGSDSWRSTVSGGAAIKPRSWYLGAASLSTSKPDRGVPADAYDYPKQSSSNGVSPASSTPGVLNGWSIPDEAGGFAVYTGPALPAAREFLGSGSADLWVSSTAPDTDLQVTLTDLRADGQEQYVARGWLRVSQRKLLKRRSTRLQPVERFRKSDVQPLTPGRPVLARVEIMPFDHLFRAGSHIRLTVDAPTGFTNGDAFRYITTPAVNRVYHQRGMASRLVLGEIPASTPNGPGCDDVAGMPCRPDPY